MWPLACCFMTAARYLECVGAVVLFEIVKTILLCCVDLQTIRNKVEFGQYQSVNDFVKDVTKMFDNCRYYNAPNTPFYRCADVLEIYFVEKLKSLKSKL